jgi:hypothetical protein
MAVQAAPRIAAGWPPRNAAQIRMAARIAADPVGRSARCLRHVRLFRASGHHYSPFWMKPDAQPTP